MNFRGAPRDAYFIRAGRLLKSSRLVLLRFFICRHGGQRGWAMVCRGTTRHAHIACAVLHGIAMCGCGSGLFDDNRRDDLESGKSVDLFLRTARRMKTSLRATEELM